MIHEEEKVRKAGGLRIVGTERHESRRVEINLEVEQDDKEIWVQVSLSLEDNLLRIFGGDRVANLINGLRLMKTCQLSPNAHEVFKCSKS